MSAGEPFAELCTTLRCGACGNYRRDSRVLPCSHRFCRQCLERSRDCFTCGRAHFERDQVQDPQYANILERFSVIVDQARVLGRLREHGAQGRAPTAEAQAAAAERVELRERMAVLEKRLRAHHILIIANARGALKGEWTAAHALPTPPAEFLLPPPPAQPAAEAEAEAGHAKRNANEPQEIAAGSGGKGGSARRVSPRESKRRKTSSDSSTRDSHEAAAEGQPTNCPPAVLAAPEPAGTAAPATSTAAASAAPAATLAAASTAASAAPATAASAAPSAAAAVPDPPKPPRRSSCKHVSMAFSSLDDAETAQAKAAAKQLGAVQTGKFQPQMTSHVVTSRPRAGSNARGSASNDVLAAPYNCGRTLKYMQAVIHGKWVVDVAWLWASLKAGYFVDEHPYECSGDQMGQMDDGSGRGAPRLGRHQVELGKPKLLQDWNCVLVGDFTSPDIKTMRELLGQMGARVLDTFPAGWAPAPTSRRKSRPAAPRRQLVGIMQQQLSELDPSARDELLRSADEARAVIVDRTWVFDSISWFEPRPFDEYPLSR